MAYNPFPGDGDFKYLALEKKELMEQQNVPFDGKKNTWIPDKKEGFVKGEIESTKGEEVTVVTDKGEVSLTINIIPCCSRRISCSMKT